MKLNLKCFKCLESVADSEHSRALKLKDYPVVLGSTRLCVYTCDLGHTTHAVISHPAYDLLFENGINALNDGYNREALLSFHAALESFYQAAVYALLIAHNREQILQDLPILRKSWSRISAQVERQIGAFYFLYFNLLGKVAPDFGDGLLSIGEKEVIGPKGLVNLRNKLTHGGLLPTRSQAIVYGETVRKYIVDIKESIDNVPNNLTITYTSFANMVIKHESDGELGRMLIENNIASFQMSLDTVLSRPGNVPNASLYINFPPTSDWPRLDIPKKKPSHK